MYKMKAFIILTLIATLCNAQQQDVETRPEPYSFNNQVQLADGTTMEHQESGDTSGTITGSYTYKRADLSIERVVRYTADDTGFHPVVETNEPGVESHSPDNAEYIQQGVPSGAYEDRGAGGGRAIQRPQRAAYGGQSAIGRAQKSKLRGLLAKKRQY